MDKARGGAKAAGAAQHFVTRANWVRAAVLGANDGIVSTASLVAGVAAAGSARAEVLLAGVAGAVAGAMSMAAGEYVSVSSQRDIEEADLARERAEHETRPELEEAELAAIYMERGLDADLAGRVAAQLTARDALGAHARDELGLVPGQRARPLQAAIASAAAFAAGATLPLAAVLVARPGAMGTTATGASLVALAILGVLSARVGGAPAWPALWRILFWGAAAMAATAAVGYVFGVTVG
ncbi:MAG: VIT family protein [Alphaproteobacteria bacterium]|nr:MAG: VIT family protein [Alphaproteobacteria bacterium]